MTSHSDRWRDESGALQQEINDAHAMLDKLGVGKPDFASLAGRIELMAAQAYAVGLPKNETVIEVAKQYFPEGIETIERLEEMMQKAERLLGMVREE